MNRSRFCDAIRNASWKVFKVMSAAHGPQPLAKALSELIALKGLAQVQAHVQLAEAWREAAGPRFAANSKVLGIKRGVLKVGVSNSPLLGELVSFHKDAIVGRLKTNSSGLGIRDIKFVLRGDLSRD